ncbi:MAG TPA: PKD domain-containing protein, partial [Bacteroidia bacterium]|nr:PKD domain-containing protein [Bacteroidia bacterium]
VNPAVTTTYVVTAQNTGCTQTAQASGIVSVYPSVNISITPIDSVCKGAQTTLAANATGGSGSGFTYTWSGGQNTASIVVSPSTTTTYTVWAHDALCPAVATTTEIYMYAEPVLTIIPSLSSGCGYACISFTAGVASNVPGNNIIPPYTWNFGDGTVINGGSNAQHCYNNTGNYNVSLIAKTQNNCLDTLKEINFIHIHQKPVADFSASAFETDIYNNTIHFYNQSTGSIVNWNWYTDTTTYTVQNPTHTYFNEGIYPVTLVVTDDIGCTDTIVKDITINPAFTFYAPNCVTPNGDGKNEVFLPIGEGWDNNHFDLWIFDRWGNMLLHTTNPYEGWDGKRYNELVQEDTYVWKVVLKDIFEKEHEYHGQVSVVR